MFLISNLNRFEQFIASYFGEDKNLDFKPGFKLGENKLVPGFFRIFGTEYQGFLRDLWQNSCYVGLYLIIILLNIHQCLVCLN